MSNKKYLLCFQVFFFQFGHARQCRKGAFAGSLRLKVLREKEKKSRKKVTPEQITALIKKVWKKI